MIKRSELKNLLHYNPDTGYFTWIESGRIAGTKNKRNNTAYIQISVKGKKYRAHRLAFLYMKGKIPRQVDHKNLNGIDNRWINLRESDPVSNARNRPFNSNNSSGVCGVRFQKDISRWIAKIEIEGKRKFLGSFGSIFEAACARKSAENKLGFNVRKRAY